MMRHHRDVEKDLRYGLLAYVRRWRLKYPESPGNPAGMGAGSSLQNAVWGDQPLRHGQFQSLQDPSLFRLGAGHAAEDQFLAVGRPQSGCRRS